ncbi:AAA family ATPase [Erythrobacter sp. MTPC3]
MLEILSRRGFHVVPEPGLRVIRSGGPAPWDSLDQFICAVIDLSKADLDEAANVKGDVFFDRGLLDALSGQAARSETDLALLSFEPFPYSEPVFYAPPWPEIFEQTLERQLPLDAAIEEAERLKRDLQALEIVHLVLPKSSAEKRADFIIESLHHVPLASAD